MTKDGPRWTGNVELVEDKIDDPLRWRKPRRVFVNSMSDLFHEKVPDEWLDRIFAVMALAHWHTFQVLTKRPERALDYFRGYPYNHMLEQAKFLRHSHRRAILARGPHGISDPNIIPWRNVWLGVSVEDQATADERIPLLIQTPAAVRWVSYEPALGPVDFEQAAYKAGRLPESEGLGISWCVVGGESGPGARPMHPAWAQSARDQCRAAGTAFFFKQHGAWVAGYRQGVKNRVVYRDGRSGDAPEDFQAAHRNPEDSIVVARVGKKRAGRELDGRTWDEMPGEEARTCR